MDIRSRDADTIVAQATPAGYGGISVIRVSGPNAYVITKKLCSFLPEVIRSHQACFGNLHSANHSSSEAIIIDEVVVTAFADGKSFTGEQSTEISCHGNPLIVKEIISQLIFCGARGADRGEFTYRAFMNGRIDLVQAEGVLSLIQSQSQTSALQSLRQLKGQLSIEFEALENDITWCLAHIEASIDFSTEGIDVVDNNVLISRLQKILKNTECLLSGYKSGQILRDGFYVALVGKPNAGKSSLLNMLLGEEKAIVTHIPGTTRDVIEGSILLNGCRVVFSDTAGLRQSADLVEQIGIQRSYEVLDKADLIFYIFDSSVPVSQEEIDLIKQLPHSKTIFIANKTDLTADGGSASARLLVKNLQGLVPVTEDMLCMTSTLNQNNVLNLKDVIAKKLEAFHFQDSTVLFQTRQYDCLLEMKKYLVEAISLVESSASPEFSALPLKETLLKVHEVLGKHFDDQIMDRVFKEFCIGK